MSHDEQKRQAAERAIEYVERGSIVGVGTGTTIAHFINALGRMKNDIQGAVSSSDQSTQQLTSLGIEVFDLNAVGPLKLYVDGADECDSNLCLIKGGGAALTREKIVAEASDRFVCIIDPSKQVEVLGRFPLPVEVIPLARSAVARALLKFDSRPAWREGVVTDNGNWILDVHGLQIINPLELECEINQIPGVVTVGLFARRRADVVIVGGQAATLTAATASK